MVLDKSKNKMIRIDGKYYYQLICEFCGKDYKSRHNSKCCSPKCSADNIHRNKSKNKTIDVHGKRYYKLVCENCNKDFLSLHNQPFCSHKCFGEDFEKRGIVGEKHGGSKYSYNRSYFKVVDSPTKAYWIGFIVGDGHVSCGQLSFGLAPKDKQLLCNFLDEINGSYEQIKDRKKERMSQLQIKSKEMVQDLIDVGVPAKNKTFMAVVPDYIPQKHISAFWLGLFDADGSVGVYKSKTSCKDGIHEYDVVSVTLTGTKDLCLNFSYFLEYEGRYVYPIANVWRFNIKGKYITDEIYKKLYKLDIQCLVRKKGIFIKMLRNRR